MDSWISRQWCRDTGISFEISEISAQKQHQANICHNYSMLCLRCSGVILSISSAKSGYLARVSSSMALTANVGLADILSLNLPGLESEQKKCRVSQKVVKTALVKVCVEIKVEEQL